MGFHHAHLEIAVKNICPQIEEHIAVPNNYQMTESQLWEELVCCLLSSQVRYEIAAQKSYELVESGVFEKLYLYDPESAFDDKVWSILHQPSRIKGREYRYRFPNKRSEQISMSRINFIKLSMTLSEVIEFFDNAFELRRTVIELVSGVGPKQASMFIRNIGVSNEIAVFDQHVQKYLTAIGLISRNTRLNFQSLKTYEKLEIEFSNYCSLLGYSPATVDYAIWIIMRTARKEEM